jgi:hypothetical protein
MKAFGLGNNHSLTQKNPPPASGVAEPSLAYLMAVKSVYCINHKAIITTLPARPIAEPVRTNMAPPIIPSIPTIIISTDLTSAPVCADVDVQVIVVTLSCQRLTKIIIPIM